MGAKNRKVVSSKNQKGGGKGGAGAASGGGGKKARAGKRADGRRSKRAGGGGSVKQRAELRADEKEARRQQGGYKRKHGGDEELARTRDRLRAKLAERKIKSLPNATPPEERYKMLQDLGQMNYDCGRTRLATENFREVLLNLPEDPHFARTLLICLYMDRARAPDARQLLCSKLFLPLLADEDLNAAEGVAKVSQADADVPLTSPALHLAAVCGCYSLAILTYVSVQVLEEVKTGDEFNAEQRLVNRVRRAHELNPFCAEFIAFHPAFSHHFPDGYILPEVSETWADESRLIREALEYLCRFGQVKVWVEHDTVRRYLQRQLFEEEPGAGDAEEKPPFAPLPAERKSDPVLLAKWRKARQDAMELWASEMSVDGDEGGESEEGEESEEEGSEDGGAPPPVSKKPRRAAGKK